MMTSSHAQQVTDNYKWKNFLLWIVHKLVWTYNTVMSALLCVPYMSNFFVQ